MRVLYGVVGEGMGHATRSRVVIEHLLAGGHDVHVAVSGRAAAFLRDVFGEAHVTTIEGLTIEYDEGAVHRGATLAHNVLRAPGMALRNARVWFDAIDRFAPEVAITDFDSFAYAYATAHGLPLLSIDNQQIFVRCWHEPELIDVRPGDRTAFEVTRAFVKAKLPGCDRWVVTTFFRPQVKPKYAERTELVPPILRRAVLDAEPRARALAADAEAEARAHVLVYQTSVSDASLLDVLGCFPDVRFVVYGLRRDEDRGHVVLRSFSEQGFVDDLADARAVVCNGGLSLMCEALALGKPVHSVPVAHQFEQVLNARYLARMGLGTMSDRFASESLGAFLADAAHYARRVRREPRHDGNVALFAAVDAWLARAR